MVPDWTEVGQPEERKPRCSYCYRENARLYDERQDVFYCDESCMYHYCADNFERLIHFHGRDHVSEL